jgi:hypothetical protein
MRELVKGQRVRATRELRSPIGGGIDLVAEGTEGTVVAGWGDSGSVKFDVATNNAKRVLCYPDDRTFWFSTYPGYPGAFHMTNLEELPALPTVEGQAFTIIKDNGDGTYQVRRDQ